MLRHVFIHILSLNLEKQAVGVSVEELTALPILSLNLEKQAVGVNVEELTALPILSLHLVEVEIIHQMFGEVEDAHPHINRTIKDQTALVHMKCCKVIIEYVSSGKGWASNKPSDLVLFICLHQLDINLFSEIFHCVPKY